MLIKRRVLKLESVLLHMFRVSVYFGLTVRNDLLLVELSARIFRSSGLTLVSFGIDEVRRLIPQCKLLEAKFDGCMLGLVSASKKLLGTPLWERGRIMITSQQLATEFVFVMIIRTSTHR